MAKNMAKIGQKLDGQKLQCVTVLIFYSVCMA
jgi:hypothetical protein